jgi:hypothetical protein
MRSVLVSLVAPALAIVATPAVAQVQIVDVSASDPTRPNFEPLPVTKTFGAGTYNVSMVGKAGGGAFDAWSVATPAGGNWNGAFKIGYDGATTTVNPYNGQRFATAQDALAAFSGVLTSFTLSGDTAVNFSIPDYLWWDNTGGVSLGVTKGAPTPVPEPGTIGLFLVGGAALAISRRRKRATVTA